MIISVSYSFICGSKTLPSYHTFDVTSTILCFFTTFSRSREWNSQIPIFLWEIFFYASLSLSCFIAHELFNVYIDLINSLSMRRNCSNKKSYIIFASISSNTSLYSNNTVWLWLLNSIYSNSSKSLDKSNHFKQMIWTAIQFKIHLRRRLKNRSIRFTTILS